MNNDEKLRNDFQDLAIDDLKYYGRRIETVNLIICGFGLYGNFELIKFFNEDTDYFSLLLMCSAILLLIAIFAFLYCLILERKIRVFYLEIINGKKVNDPNPHNASLKLEKKLIKINTLSYVFIVVAFILSLIAIGIFFFNK